MKHETMNEPTKYFKKLATFRFQPSDFGVSYFQLVQDLAKDLASYVSLLSVPWLMAHGTVRRRNGELFGQKW